MARVTCKDCGRMTEPQEFMDYVGDRNERGGFVLDHGNLVNPRWEPVTVNRCDRCQAALDAAESRSEQLYASSYGLGQ